MLLLLPNDFAEHSHGFNVTSIKHPNLFMHVT